ncbi:hypothetical protein [Actinomycetospora chiangmaiensis]|uniref:hypothetical protein n=1 Tax=Actinomycetospora chiangmaiensis TaxID=402650 RepID=UPI0003678371|nr:hypothetical protein [Actinomycetospora chiangmaiensis]
MQIAFTFTRLAVIVRRWFEIGPDATMEHGTRVELRLLEPQPHRGTESAAQRLVVDGAVWRADLFDRLDRPAGSFSAAHHHPTFDGVEPSDRVWSDALTADPWGWLAAQLTDVATLLREAGHDPALADDDAEDLREQVPHIVATARRFGPEDPMSRDGDFRLTRDAAERVRRMLDLIDAPTPAVRDHLRPWLEQA